MPAAGARQAIQIPSQPRKAKGSAETGGPTSRRMAASRRAGVCVPSGLRGRVLQRKALWWSIRGAS